MHNKICLIFENEIETKPEMPPSYMDSKKQEPQVCTSAAAVVVVFPLFCFDWTPKVIRGHHISVATLRGRVKSSENKLSLRAFFGHHYLQGRETGEARSEASPTSAVPRPHHHCVTSLQHCRSSEGQDKEGGWDLLRNLE